jgi:glycoside/pentoside/hexuronide:cation symporter, GPH family
MTKTLPLSKKIIYAMGQFGWSLASYSTANLINYFYMPPEESAGAIFPPFVFQGTIIGILTIVGVLNFGGRFFDAVTDPLLASFSDRTRSRFGKRSVFMAVSGLPFAVLSVLVFLPPAAGVSGVNTVWLAVMLFLFYLAMTAYVVPYTALISEYGHSASERLTLSTMISVTWALGFAAGNLVYALQAGFESVLPPHRAFAAAVGIFAFAALVMMYLPVIFIRENDYVEERVSREGAFSALLAAFRNREFLLFTISDLMYWLALTFIQAGISYYITVLLGMKKGLISLLMTVMFAMSFVFYVPVTVAARKFGKKKLMIAAFIVFAVVFVIVALLGVIPLAGAVQAFTMVILAAFPMAVFGIMPNAIVGDLAESDGMVTGNYKAGTFYGARALMMKLGISLANLIFPSLLLLGKSVENSLGIRLTAVSAFVFCLAGLILFLRYREKKVLDILSRKEKTDGAL